MKNACNICVTTSSTAIAATGSLFGSVSDLMTVPLPPIVGLRQLAILVFAVLCCLALSEAARKFWRTRVASAVHDRHHGSDILDQRSLLARAECEFARCRIKRLPFSVVVLRICASAPSDDTQSKQNYSASREVGSVARSSAGENSFVGRYAPNDLLVVLPGASWLKAITFAQKVRNEFVRHRCQFELSIGVSTATISDRDFGDVLQNTKAALGKAGPSAGNRVISTTPMHEFLACVGIEHQPEQRSADHATCIG